MAYKYREDLVGKRFLSVSGVTKINVNKVAEWGWKAGVIRAASLKDNKNKELQVLVEYDGVDWQRREWVAVYSRRTFRVFLVERTLVWAPRNYEGKEVQWPALTFTPLAADVTLQADSQPVEFLHDQHLQFTDYGNLMPYQEWDAQLAGAESVDSAILAAVSAQAVEWRTTQDGQRILTTTPSVLGGCRAQVYRAAGATQWYTAVIVGVNEHTGELTVTDDTVLEEHSEDPSLVQMRLLGDGVIESIMRGEVVGVMPRRSRSNLQRVERESTKSPATTGGRKKAGTVRSNGQIAQAEPPPQPPGSSPERESSEINKKGVTESVSASGDVVDASEETKCVKQEEVKPECPSEGEVKSEVSGGAGADGVASAVASEEDDCVIVCARDADDRSDSGVSGVRSGGSASSVEEWRGMAHGYGGGPPPPLLHLAPPPPSIYASELLWKQRYPPPLHPPLHHAIADDYLAAATFDRERHERLLRERRDQEQRDMLEKQQKEKERERVEREREREREREKQEREEKERREQDAASKLVSRHFEESLRRANQKREQSMSWSLLNSLAPVRGGAGEHERLRAPHPERAYYSPPAHAPHPHPSAPAPRPSQPDYSLPHARLAIPKPEKPQSHQSLPKGEPNFAPYNYPPYRPAYDKMKDPHLPAPPPLVPEKNSVIVKHDAKQIHLEQKHPYGSKPRSEPSPHYLQSLPHRPHRAALSPHAPPHPHPAHPAPLDKGRRLYQPAQPQRSPAGYYQPSAPPGKPKVSSPAPPHIYGKPANSPSPVHYAVAVEPPLQLKAEPPPVPYPPPSPYSPLGRSRPPPAAHSRTPPRAHLDAPAAPANSAPCQTQPLDLGVARDDPDRLSPRRRCPFDLADSDPKRRRLEEHPAPEPLIAAAASVGRAPHGSEPAPQAPGPPCDVRVPSADGSVETPEKAAGASPAPSVTPSASPAPATPVPPLVSSPPVAAPPPTATPPRAARDAARHAAGRGRRHAGQDRRLSEPPG